MEIIGRAIDLSSLKFRAVVGTIAGIVDIYLLIATALAAAAMISDAAEMKKKGLLREYRAVRFMAMGLLGGVAFLYAVTRALLY